MSIAKVLFLPYRRPQLYPKFIKNVFLNPMCVSKCIYKGGLNMSILKKRQTLRVEVVSNFWVFREFIEEADVETLQVVFCRSSSFLSLVFVKLNSSALAVSSVFLLHSLLHPQSLQSIVYYIVT